MSSFSGLTHRYKVYGLENSSEDDESYDYTDRSNSGYDEPEYKDSSSEDDYKIGSNDEIQPSSEELLAQAVIRDDADTILELITKIDDASLAYAEAITHNRTQKYPILALKTLSFDLPLERAAAKGDLDLVKQLGPKTVHGRSVAAGIAAEKGHIYVTDYLMELGGVNEAMVLYGAAKGGRLPLVKLLLESVTSWDVVRQTFIQACTGGHLDTVKFLYGELDTDDDAAPSIKTGLKRAAEHGHLTTVQWLVAEILAEAPQLDLEPILTAAARSGSPELVSYLLTFDLDNVEDALNQAVSSGKREIIELILAHVSTISEITLNRIIRRRDVQGFEKYLNSSNALSALNVAWDIRDWNLVRMCRNLNPRSQQHIIRLLRKAIRGGDVEPFKQIGDLDIELGENDVHIAIRTGNRELTDVVLKYVSSVTPETIVNLIQNRWCDLVQDNIDKARRSSQYFIESLTHCPNLSSMLALRIDKTYPVAKHLLRTEKVKALNYVKHRLDPDDVSKALYERLGDYPTRPVEKSPVFAELLEICNLQSLLEQVIQFKSSYVNWIYSLTAYRIGQTDNLVDRAMRNAPLYHFDLLLPELRDPDRMFGVALRLNHNDAAQALVRFVKDPDTAILMAINSRHENVARLLVPKITNYYQPMIDAGTRGMKSLFEELMIRGDNQIYDITN